MDACNVWFLAHGWDAHVATLYHFVNDDFMWFGWDFFLFLFFYFWHAAIFVWLNVMQWINCDWLASFCSCFSSYVKYTCFWNRFSYNFGHLPCGRRMLYIDIWIFSQVFVTSVSFLLCIIYYSLFTMCKQTVKRSFHI